MLQSTLADVDVLTSYADDEERRAEIDKHKSDSLDKQKEGQGHWKRELASHSEAAVRLTPDVL